MTIPGVGPITATLGAAGLRTADGELSARARLLMARAFQGSTRPAASQARQDGPARPQAARWPVCWLQLRRALRRFGFAAFGFGVPVSPLTASRSKNCLHHRGRRSRRWYRRPRQVRQHLRKLIVSCRPAGLAPSPAPLPCGAAPACAAASASLPSASADRSHPARCARQDGHPSSAQSASHADGWPDRSRQTRKRPAKTSPRSEAGRHRSSRTACCSASPFDPPESQRINVLPRRSAPNLRA